MEALQERPPRAFYPSAEAARLDYTQKAAGDLVEVLRNQTQDPLANRIDALEMLLTACENPADFCAALYPLAERLYVELCREGNR